MYKFTYYIALFCGIFIVYVKGNNVKHSNNLINVSKGKNHGHHGANMGNKRLLRHTPFIMAHDAATTYLHMSVITREIENWARTQPKGGFKKLLNCGTRAFDIRTKKTSDNRVVMHHGAFEIDFALKDALAEIFDWSIEQNENELVLLYLSKFEGENDEQATRNVLSNLNIPILPNNHVNITYEEALRFSETKHKGERAHVLALFGDIKECYDPTIICSSFSFQDKHASNIAKGSVVNVVEPQFDYSLMPKPNLRKVEGSPTSDEMLKWHNPFIEFSCFGTNAHIPMSKFEVYMGQHTTKPFDSFWITQAHWQYNTASVIAGTLLGSTILLDESRSKLNQRVANGLQNNLYQNVNLLELDNVCNEGPKIFQILKEKYTLA